MERTYRRPTGCLSDLRIDRLIVDELDTPDRAATLAHADACAWCSLRISELRTAQSDFAAQPLPRSLRPRRPTWLGASAGLAAAAALAIVFAIPPHKPRPVLSDDDVRSKGSPHLDLQVERDGLLEPLLPGDRIRPGARVQPSYTAAAPGWLAIFGVDGAGRVQRHYPVGTDASAFVPAGRAEPLPFSLTFDSIPGLERIIAVHCPWPLDLAAVERQLATGATPSLDPGCAVDRLEFAKEDP